MQDTGEDREGRASRGERVFGFVAALLFGGGLVWVGSLFDQEKLVGMVVAPVVLMLGFALLGEAVREITPEHLRPEPEPAPPEGKHDLTIGVGVIALFLLVTGVALLLLTFTPQVVGVEKPVSDVVGVLTSFFGFGLSALGIGLLVQVALHAVGRPTSFFDDF